MEDQDFVRKGRIPWMKGTVHGMSERESSMGICRIEDRTQ